MDRAPYLVQLHLSLRDERLYIDAHRFQLMRYRDEEHFIYVEQFREKLFTGAGALEPRWKHSGGKGAIGSQFVRFYTE